MSDFSERFVKQTEALLHFQHDETLQETTPERLHEALGQVIMMEISDNWTKTKRRQAPGRRAFYFSAEYLVGRLVYSNLFNLGILREMKPAFAENGVDLACQEHIEDAALGNGGLGRLAACFLDSAATLDAFLAADIVVIGTPMYNFGIPSQLKAWIDRIAVAGKTFRYSEKGPEGLAGGKRIVIASARGGVYSAGAPAEPNDFQENYLRAVFGFLGVTDIEIVRAEGLAMGPDQRQAAMAAALQASTGLDRLAQAA